MPLSKKQIAQRKNFKNRSNNSFTGQFEESKVSDSSDSDFILSDEIYSSDSSINISDTDTEMTLEQDKKDLVNFNLISIVLNKSFETFKFIIFQIKKDLQLKNETKFFLCYKSIPFLKLS